MSEPNERTTEEVFASVKRLLQDISDGLDSVRKVFENIIEDLETENEQE